MKFNPGDDLELYQELKIHFTREIEIDIDLLKEFINQAIKWYCNKAEKKEIKVVDPAAKA